MDPERAFSCVESIYNPGGGISVRKTRMEGARGGYGHGTSKSWEFFEESAREYGTSFRTNTWEGGAYTLFQPSRGTFVSVALLLGV